MNAADPSPNEVPAIEARGVSLRYGNGTLANDDVSMRAPPAEIHAVVGENGAGKSTLMKMLFGLERPTAGQILLDGKAVRFKGPGEALAAGVGLVPQHIELVGDMSVAQNVALGCEPARFGWVDQRRTRRQVAEAAERFGLAVDVDTPAAALSVGQRQRAGLLKCLYRGARVLLLDEPTAVLAPGEIDALFRSLQALTAQGTTIVMITHRLDEALETAQSYTVLRGGRLVGAGRSRNATPQALSALMFGTQRAATDLPARQAKAPGLTRLRGVDVTAAGGAGRQALDALNFDILAGEILGIAGVEGNGQRELAEVLSGAARMTSGELTLNGVALANQGVRQAREMGVAFVTEDRLHDGVSAAMSIADNTVAGSYYQPPFATGGWLHEGVCAAHGEAVIRDMNVRARDAQLPIGLLSGGNMQKVVLGRELACAPALLVASQPTRGVDLAAARVLREHLLRLRDQGAAILLISADLDELLDLSDRVAVMLRGRFVAHFDGDGLEVADLADYMTGLAAARDVRACRAAPRTARASVALRRGDA